MSANSRQVGGAHYQGGIQHWDMVVACRLGYFEGNITKYVTRARKRSKVQDIEKALHYLEKLREVADKIPRWHLHGMHAGDLEEYLRAYRQFNSLTDTEAWVIYAMCTWKDSDDLTRVQSALQELLAALRLHP